MSPEAFEPHRRKLFGLAYRMLGSVASAEDVLQEVWVRWVDADDVQHPAAWLSTVCGRLCLDEARSARARREEYVGPWLPEPVLTAEPPSGLLGESLTMAFLLLLEQLSAPQRAAWLLREVFDEDYDHIAAVLQSTPAACRQLVRRARVALAEGRARYAPEPGRHHAILAAFGAAVVADDLQALEAVLTEDVVFTGDGGGQVAAARRPVRGRTAVARLLQGLSRMLPAGVMPTPVAVNAGPGLVLAWPDGRPYAVVALEIRDGRVAAVRNVANPAKLGHLALGVSSPGAPES